jgi:hypothetical protein
MQIGFRMKGAQNGRSEDGGLNRHGRQGRGGVGLAVFGSTNAAAVTEKETPMRLKDVMTTDIVTSDSASRTYTVAPPVHIRVLGVEMEDGDRDNIVRKLGMKLGKFASSIERITVRLSDANGPKGGRDQICQIKVVLSGLPSIVVEERAAALHTASEGAMKATALAVRRRVQRRRLKALHHRASQPVASEAS